MNWEFFRPSKSTSICLVLLLVSFLLMTFRLTSFVQTFRSLVQYWISPSYEITFDMLQTSKGLGSRLAEIASAHHENSVLKEKIKRTSLIESDLRELSNENERLRALLNFKEASSFLGTFAQVISRDYQNWTESIIIDKGMRESVGQDFVVFAIQGDPLDDSKVLCSIVGRVVEPNLSSSKVLLISDPLSSVAVALERNDEQGLLQGQGSYLMTLEYLDQVSDVQKGDEVVTSGLGGIFPRGIKVGKVEKVTTLSSGFKRAQVSSFIPLNRLREVFVAKNNSAGFEKIGEEPGIKEIEKKREVK